MFETAIEALIRASATHYVAEVRQFWLFGLKPGDRLYDRYAAANAVCYPTRHRRFG